MEKNSSNISHSLSLNSDKENNSDVNVEELTLGDNSKAM